MNPFRGGWIIVLTLVVAATLSVARLPSELPAWVAGLRPDWVTVALFFWLIERPQRISLPAVWAFGLLLDVLHSTPLGLNGLCLATLALIGWAWYERLRMNSMLQQALVLFVAALALAAIRGVGAFWAQDAPITHAWVTAAAMSALLWPLTRAVLRATARSVE